MTGNPTWAERSVLVTGATGMVGLGADEGARRRRQSGHRARRRPRSAERVDPQRHDRSRHRRERPPRGCRRGRAGDHRQRRRHGLPSRRADHRVDRAPITRATFEANVQGTWNVLDVARLHPTLVQSVVVASSDKAYGESTVAAVHGRDAARRHVPLRGLEVDDRPRRRSYALTYGVPVAIARCGNIYGPGDLNWSRIVPGNVPLDPPRRAAGAAQRRNLPPRLPACRRRRRARISRSSTRPRRHPAAPTTSATSRRPRVLEIYAACCVAAGVPGLEPKILDQAVGEIKDQYLDSSLARSDLKWRAEVRLADGPRADVSLVPGPPRADTDDRASRSCARRSSSSRVSTTRSRSPRRRSSAASPRSR